MPTLLEIHWPNLVNFSSRIFIIGDSTLECDYDDSIPFWNAIMTIAFRFGMRL